MKLKIKVTTPKGHAKRFEKQLRTFLLGFNRVSETEITSDDTTILWVVEADTRRYMKIARNVAMFDHYCKNIIQNKMVQRVAKLSDQDKKELEIMLSQQTKVELTR